ncbi:MAG: winged helix-turn-helix domain-containing protein [Lachnospiraceae bacterium]|nr:winged helix-turn-helix domain-containing protein [Lachnospiraceae bacterium]
MEKDGGDERSCGGGVWGTERKIVEFILDNPGITQEQIAENMGMSKNGIRYTMGKLKDKGILMREGATKKGELIERIEVYDSKMVIKWKVQDTMG